MGILSWIVFGAITGWITSKLVGSSSNQGIVVDIILGVLGAFVGGMLMNFLGKSGVTGFNLYSFAVALVGSMVVVFVKNKLLK